MGLQLLLFHCKGMAYSGQRAARAVRSRTHTASSIFKYSFLLYMKPAAEHSTRSKLFPLVCSAYFQMLFTCTGATNIPLLLLIRAQQVLLTYTYIADKQRMSKLGSPCPLNCCRPLAVTSKAPSSGLQTAAAKPRLQDRHSRVCCSCGANIKLI
jgi:hypothetical protein